MLQLKRMTDAGVEVYIGGGEGGTALEKYGQDVWVTHVFTAGGTVLNALGSEPVPYLVALRMAARQTAARLSRRRSAPGIQPSPGPPAARRARSGRSPPGQAEGRCLTAPAATDEERARERGQAERDQVKGPERDAERREQEEDDGHDEQDRSD